MTAGIKLSCSHSEISPLPVDELALVPFHVTRLQQLPRGGVDALVRDRLENEHESGLAACAVHVSDVLQVSLHCVPITTIT